MSPPRIVLARLVLPACLAVAGGESRGQAPTDPPPLPDVPAAPAPAPAEPPAVGARPAPACTPGRCVHRGPLARRRCKRHLQEAFLGFPEEFERPPLGAVMHAVNAVQVDRGEAAGMVFYQFDFVSGTTRLNVRGIDKLGAIAARLPATFHPVIVERTGLPALDDRRRAVVLEALASGPFPVPAERVVVGPPIARGLRGEEAAIIHEGSLIRIQQAGPPVGSTVDSPNASGGN